MKTELLAPAGDKEAAYSAFYFGADAIYLGLKQFSARAEAVNFDKNDLDEITAYAHHLGKKVYVAINTLMQEDELPLLMESLKMCQDCFVDAVIVQDLGVTRLVKKCFPSLALHASTQMAVHNLKGALALKKQGFERVVLARELSLNEIINIKEKAGLEIEVFIHGALCYSYSGLCSFSSLTTGRSANRGKCVYSCRSLFERKCEKKHLFSMKDMALEKEVLKLDGISLKIEGRKKTALYVGAVTDYYRKILDTGKIDASLTDNLKQIFARPWTKLHFQGKNKSVIDMDFVGHRGLQIGVVDKIHNNELTFKTNYPIERYDGIQIDVQGVEKPFGFSAEKLFVNKKPVFEVKKGQVVTVKLPEKFPFIQKKSAVYLSSSTRVKRSYGYQKPKPREFINQKGIDVSVFISKDEIRACIEDTSVVKKGEFSPAKQAEKVYETIKNVFSKTGETPFKLNELYLENKDNLFVPLSVLNEIRRQLYATVPVESIKVSLPVYNLKQSKNKTPKWSIKTDQYQLLKEIDLSFFDRIIIDITDELNIKDIDFIDKNKVILALPPVIRNQEKWQKKVDEFFGYGYLKWLVGNISGLQFIHAKGSVYFDNTIGILNSQSLAYAFEQKVKGITLSVEDTKENIHKLSTLSEDVTLVLYQDIPLFISANCVRENDCTTCTHKPLYEEIKNNKDVFLMCSKNCETYVMKKTPFYIGSDVKGIYPDFYRLDFCRRPYKKEEVQKIIEQAKSFQKIKNTFTGNFNKKFS